MLDLELTIHTHLASLGNWRGRKAHAALKLWYWLRAIDRPGAGKVEFSLELAASHLACSSSTIKKYLFLGKKEGLFRFYRCSGDRCIVYSSSRDKLALSLGLKSWGTSVVLRLNQLKALRFYIYEGEAKAAQGRAIHAAKRSHKASFKRLNSFLWTFLKGRRAIAQRIFMTLAEDLHFYGSSQATIAQALNVSERTINRNFNFLHRIENSVDPILKVQQVQISKLAASAQVSRDASLISAFRGIKLDSSRRRYKPLPNVYDSPLQLRSQKVARRKYKQGLSIEPVKTDRDGGGFTISKSYGLGKT